ncbi:hypothetical protein [Nonomuraea endophytica]|uniref:hypothetical protein n=1 Tax=Nonomuraea endophytica TaxID=714136 RepID=UPI0037C867F7
MPTSGGAPGGAGQLSAYVRTYLEERDLSERALAERAIDPETGFALQHGWINQLAKGRVPRAPEVWRLRALAAAMQVPIRLLADLAGAQWLGIEVAEVATGEGWVAIAVPAGLSPEQRARFAERVGALQGREDGDWVAISVPASWSEEEKDRFVRMAEDMVRHLGK